MILRETHIALLKGFGLVTLVGSLLLILSLKGYEFDSLFLSFSFISDKHMVCMFLLINVMGHLQCGMHNNVGDLEKQPFYRFLQRTYVVHPIALAVLLYAMGGLPFIVWGMVSKIIYLSF